MAVQSPPWSRAMVGKEEESTHPHEPEIRTELNRGLDLAKAIDTEQPRRAEAQQKSMAKTPTRSILRTSSCNLGSKSAERKRKRVTFEVPSKDMEEVMQDGPQGRSQQNAVIVPSPGSLKSLRRAHAFNSHSPTDQKVRRRSLFKAHPASAQSADSMRDFGRERKSPVRPVVRELYEKPLSMLSGKQTTNSPGEMIAACVDEGAGGRVRGSPGLTPPIGLSTTHISGAGLPTSASTEDTHTSLDYRSSSNSNSGSSSKFSSLDTTASVSTSSPEQSPHGVLRHIRMLRASRRQFMAAVECNLAEALERIDKEHSGSLTTPVHTASLGRSNPTGHGHVSTKSRDQIKSPRTENSPKITPRNKGAPIITSVAPPSTHPCVPEEQFLLTSDLPCLNNQVIQVEKQKSTFIPRATSETVKSSYAARSASPTEKTLTSQMNANGVSYQGRESTRPRCKPFQRETQTKQCQGGQHEKAAVHCGEQKQEQAIEITVRAASATENLQCETRSIYGSSRPEEPRIGFQRRTSAPLQVVGPTGLSSALRENMTGQVSHDGVQRNMRPQAPQKMVDAQLTPQRSTTVNVPQNALPLKRACRSREDTNVKNSEGARRTLIIESTNNDEEGLSSPFPTRMISVNHSPANTCLANIDGGASTVTLKKAVLARWQAKRRRTLYVDNDPILKKLTTAEVCENKEASTSIATFRTCGETLEGAVKEPADCGERSTGPLVENSGGIITSLWKGWKSKWHSVTKLWQGN